MLSIVFGVPGVGKTTVLNAAAKIVPFAVINFGDYMLAEAKKQRLVKSRDELRMLSKEVQISLQQRAAKRIKADAKVGNFAVDTHASVKTPRGYMPGLPEKVLHELAPDAFFIIEADPEEILKRRLNDSSRKRDDEMLNEIEEHQMINRCFTAVYAELTDAPVLLVKNSDGRLEAVGKIIAEAFK